MSSRPPTPTKGSAQHGGAGAHEGAASLVSPASPPTTALARAGAYARGCARAIGALFHHPVSRSLRRTLRRLALAAVLAVVAAMLLVRFVLWPQASTARAWLEERGSTALSAQFTIGQLDSYWDGWHPAFRARDIRAVDKEGHVLFGVATLDGQLSWRSLISLDLQFVQLAATQTDLLVQRTPAGRVTVGGMAIDPAGKHPGDDRFLKWMLSQGKLDIRSGKLRWLDQKKNLPQLEVGDIQLSVAGSGARHTVHLTASSPALAPQPLELKADFRDDYLHSAGDWRYWNGQASWDLALVQLPVVQRYLPVFDAAASGTFSTDGTVQFSDGRITRSQTRLRASQVDIRLTGAAESLRLANAQALMEHSARRDGSHQLTVDTLLWQPYSGEGRPDAAWREGMRKVTLAWAFDDKRQLRLFDLKAPTLDLNTLRAVAASLPIETATLRQIRALQPAGHLENLDVQWSRQPARLLSRGDQKPHYRVQGTLRDVSVNGLPANPLLDANGKPNPGQPGFSNLSGNFSFDDQQGMARIEGSSAGMVFPGVFEDPRLRFDVIGGEVRWTHEQGHLVMRTDGIRFANADTAGSVRGSWRAGGDSVAGIADLSGELSRAEVNRVPRYLPMGIPAETRHYLAGALTAGSAANVTFLVKGDLTHFPFHGKDATKGDFSVDVPISQVGYQIAPHESGHAGGKLWPTFTEIAGQVQFSRGGLTFLAKSATVDGIPGVALHDVKGQIDDLGDHGRLAIDGHASGAMQSFLRYVAASPVRDWIGHITDDTRAQGNGELKLTLDMPLANAEEAKVDGQFRLPGNDVQLFPQLPLLAGASGVMAFNEHGFSLDKMRARFLGGETHIAGGSQQDGTVRVTVNGNVTANALRETMAGTGLAPLADKLSGSTAYRAVIGGRDQALQVQVGSELAGMAVGLPAPLAKEAAQETPLRFDLHPAPGGKPGAQEVVVQYGNALNARYLLRRNGETLEVQAGGIGVQQPAPTPAAGVTAALTMERFDLDAWHDALGAAQPTRRGSDAGPPSPWMPERIVARARTLHAMGRDLDDVNLEATRQGAGWNFQLDSRQIAGAVQWRDDPASSSGAMKLRLSRLNIPDGDEESNVVDALASNIDELPGLDLVADQFVLRGKDFGKLVVQAHTERGDKNGESGWMLDKLSIEQPGATLTGSGSWRVPRRLHGEGTAEQRRTRLDFKIDIRDAGDVLERMGLPHTLRDGSGTLEGRIAWHGSPLSIDYPSLSGKLKLELGNGQILSVEPGAARLLGVLSLQGLLRFATLDFRTLSSKGLMFDTVTGTGSIENGVATIQDFRLKSPQIIATMTGSANLLRETQDLKVDVVPRINATSTSVAAAFINPVLGLGTLAAQLIFADEFSRVFTQHYHVHGGWASPQIAKVEDNTTKLPSYQQRFGPLQPLDPIFLR